MKRLNRSTLIGSVAAYICFGLATPLLAAELPVTSTANQSSPSQKNVSATKPAEKCLSDLRAFDNQMEKDGYWLGGSGYGYGYPMGAYGYGYPANGYPAGAMMGYQNARPGYEVRALIASATILAWHGQQQSCEQVLATTRNIYKLYVTDMQSGKIPAVDLPNWRNQAIAAAQPVMGMDRPFRSDELIGAPVRSPQDMALGSIEDIVMSPQTGKIAYLVIARGGIFGIDEKYVPVPWEDFRITQNVNVLVLDTTKDTLDGAPRVNRGQFTTSGQFDQVSQTVDSYWKTHLSNEGNVSPKG